MDLGYKMKGKKNCEESLRREKSDCIVGLSPSFFFERGFFIDVKFTHLCIFISHSFTQSIIYLLT